MSRVFLMGPLAWTPVLDVVLGRRGQTTPVDLNHVTLGALSAFPNPRVSEGATARGVSLDVDHPDDYSALSFFATVLGAHPVPKHGRAAGARVSGILFVADTSDDADPFDFDTWVGEWGEIARIAAQEIMTYHRRLPALDVAWRLPMILSRASARVAAQTTHAPRLRSCTGAHTVTVHGCQTPHEGFFLTRSYDLQHPRFDGTMSDAVRREVFVATDAVIVLPYDPVRDRVLLVEQFRMGPFGRGDPYPWVLEPVAGRVDAGETTQAAARRECTEEAGLTLHHMEHVSSHYCSPGASTEYYHCFVALTDLPDTASGSGGVDTEHEDIRTHVLSFSAAMDLLASGEANIGPMVLLLLWLERERSRLRALA